MGRARLAFHASVIVLILMLMVTLATQALLAMAISANSYTIILGRAVLSLPVAVVVFLATFPPDERRTIQQLLRIPV